MLIVCISLILYSAHPKACFRFLPYFDSVKIAAHRSIIQFFHHVALAMIFKNRFNLKIKHHLSRLDGIQIILTYVFKPLHLMQLNLIQNDRTKA